MVNLGVTEMGVAVMLGSSTIIAKLEHGIYALLGRRVGADAVESARTRMRVRIQGNSGIRYKVGANEFLLQVTEASLYREQYTLPAHFRHHFPGPDFEVFDEAGALVGSAHVNRSGAVTGLNRLLPGLQVGDCIHVQAKDGAMWVGVRQGLDGETVPETQGAQVGQLELPPQVTEADAPHWAASAQGATIAK